MKIIRNSLLFLFVALSACVSCAAQTLEHALIPDGNILLPGEGKWDYIVCDEDGQRLYVSHGDRVHVVDLEMEKLAGDVLNTPGVHGIALAKEFNLGFTSNGSNATVTVFDLQTLAVKTVLAIPGEKPDGILYDAWSKKIFVFNGASKNVVAIDPSVLKISGALQFEGTPEAAVSDGAGNIYVNMEDRNSVVVFSASTLTKKDEWPLAPCAQPTGMGIDAAHHRLFVGGRNKLLAVVDMATGAVVGRCRIGGGVDGTVYDAKSGYIFTSNKEGTVSVCRPDDSGGYTSLPPIVTLPGAKTMALDVMHRKIYLPVSIKNGGSNQFAVLKYSIR